MDDVSWRAEWDAQAERWIALTQSDPMYDHINKPAFLDLLPPPVGITLEVGCGEGRIARELEAVGHTVIGVDGSHALTRAARGNTLPIPVGVGDIHSLPFRDDAADLVVCFMVLMDIDDLDTAVAELARVLKPTGRLCVGVLHPIATSGLFLPGDEQRTFYMGEYLKPMRHVLDIERFDGSTFRFRVEHRPIEHYSRSIEAAGLVIEAIREPRPTAEDAARDPALANWARVPDFLHLRAAKVR